MSSTGERATAMLPGFDSSGAGRLLRRRAASHVLVVAALFLGTGAAIAQTHAMGLTPSDPGLLDKLPTARLERGYVALDRVDLSPSLPPPGDQRKDGTCAAWAAVYGAASYYARLQLHAPNMTLSPSYVFNQVEHDRKQCAGSKLAEVLLFLMRRGSATLEDYPPSLFCEDEDKAALAATPVFRIPAAELLANAPYDDAGDRIVKRALDVDIVRQKLAEGHPVIVGMRTTDAILDNLPAGEIYSEHAAGDPAREHGRHALLLVGYDNEKQAFRLMNSWGADWSDHGYGWISYPSARSEIEEAFSIVSDRPPPTPVPAPAPAPAHRPDGPDVGVLACSDLSVVRSPAGYRLQGFVENEADRANVLAVLSADEATLRVSGRPVRAGEIDVRPWPQCEALLALKTPLAAADRPQLRTLDGRTAFALGDRFGFELQAPNYPAFLYLIYLQADGQAVNLLPRLGPVRQQVAPRAVLRIGDPARPGPKFTASAPTGGEVVIAVASRSPIAQLEDLEQAGGRYFRVGMANDPQDRRVLSALNDGLQTRPLVGDAPRQITADVLFLTIGR